MPVNGEILEFNTELESNPELVNSDPYGNGWMIKVKVTEKGDELVSASEYGQLIEG